MTERAWRSSADEKSLPTRRAGGGGGGGGGGARERETAIGGEKRGKMLVFIVATLSLLVQSSCDAVTFANEGALPLRPVANLSATETETAIVLSWQETVQTNSSSGGAAKPQPLIYYQISASADGGGWLELGRCSHPCSQLYVTRQGGVEGVATGTRYYNFSVVAYRATVVASAPAFAALNVTTAGAPAVGAGLIAGITAAVVIASGLVIFGSLRIARLLRDRAVRHRKGDGNANNGTAHGTLPQRLLENTSPDLQKIRRSERFDAVGISSAKDSRVFLTTSSGHFGSSGADSDTEFGYYSSYWKNRSSNATYQNLDSLHTTRCSAADESAAVENSGFLHATYVTSRPAVDDDRWSSKLASDANHAGHYNCATRRSSSSRVSSDGPSVLDVSSSDHRGTRNPASRASAATSGRQCAMCPSSGFCDPRDAVCCPFAAAASRRPSERGRPQAHRSATQRQQNERRDGPLDSLGVEGPADCLVRPQYTPMLQHGSTHLERSAYGGACESFAELNGSDVSLLGNVELRDSFIPLRFFPSCAGNGDKLLSPRQYAAIDANDSVGMRQLANISIGQCATAGTLVGECPSSAIGSDSNGERNPVGLRSPLGGWDPKSLTTSPTVVPRSEWQLPKQSRDDDLAAWCWPNCPSPAVVDVPPTLAAVCNAPAPSHRSLASLRPSNARALTDECRPERTGAPNHAGGRMLISRELIAPTADLTPPLAYSSPAISSQPPPFSFGNLSGGASLPLASWVSPPARGTSMSSSLSLASSSSRTERCGREQLRRATAEVALRTKVSRDTSPSSDHGFRGCLERGRNPNQSPLGPARPDCNDGKAGSHIAAAALAERPTPVEPFLVTASARSSEDAPRLVRNWQSAAAVLPPVAYRDVAHLNFYEKAKAISFREYPSLQPRAEAAPWPEVGLSPDAAVAKALDSGASERSNQLSQTLSPTRSETPPWEKYAKASRAADSLNRSGVAGLPDDTAQSQTTKRPDVARVETLLRELHAYQNSGSSCRDMCSPSAAGASSAASSHKFRHLETEM